MAGRNIKVGLSYFPMDVDFFSDIKVRKLIKYKGSAVITIYLNLLCSIYREGYYIKWDNDMPFIISELTGFDEEQIKDVINYCIKIELFSKKMFDEKSILTSKGIQERYKMICNLRKGKATISEFMLINSEEIIINSEENTINSELMQQSKVNKIEVNKTKANLDLFFELLMDDEAWLQLVLNGEKRLYTIDDVKEYFTKFYSHAKTVGEFKPKEIKEVKKYFNFWLQKVDVKSKTLRLDYVIGERRPK